MPFLQSLVSFCTSVTKRAMYIPAFFLERSLLAYSAFTKVDFPAESRDPIKLWLYHVGTIYAFQWGKIFEKLRICTQLQFIRFLLNSVPVGKESKLFIEDSRFEHVPIRIYHPKTPSSELRRGFLYMHGGCAVVGSKRTYELLCRFLARESDSVVVFLDFRLAPEHQHPAQLTDCLTGTLYFMNHAKNYGVDPNRIILIGESSGGTLVSTICRELVKKMHVPKVRAQILLYPFLQILDLSLPAHQQNQFGPALTMRRAAKLAFTFLDEKLDNVDDMLNNAHIPEIMRMQFKKWISADLIPEKFKARGYKPPPPVPFSKELYEKVRLYDKTMSSPIQDVDAIIQQLPETYILTCEYDIFRDDGLLYKKRLEDNGVRVTWNHLEDGFHGVALFIDTGITEFACTRSAFEDLLQFIKKL
ncbi:arylacetamide deacetylase-like 4 isoform X1 [Anolis carolinensis]